MQRAIWFKVHSYVGFKLSILLSFILITGTLAVFSYELDWATNSAMRVSPESAHRMDWQRVYQQLYETRSDSAVQSLSAPRDPWFAAEAVHKTSSEKLQRLFFHPVSGEYQGTGRWYNWQRFFRMTHRHLMMPKTLGVSIVGLLGVLLMVSLVTSLVVYKNWWRGFWRIPRRSHRQLFWADMHRLMGVWSLWFMFIIAATGVWYLAENWGLNATYPKRPKATSEPAIAAAILPSPARFSKMLKLTAEHYPDLQIQRVNFPQKSGQAVVFQGDTSAVLVRHRVNAIAFDPVTGAMLSLIRGDDMSPHVRLSEAADPLHFGTFGGLPTRILYFLFGAILSVLAVSGTYLYGIRIAKSNKAMRAIVLQKQPLQKTSQPGANRIIWQAATATMGWGKWLSLLGIAICAGLTLWQFLG